MISFSLWAEPWIPVQMADGVVVKKSLPDVLMGAHLIRGILDPSPLVTVALHRLLLALLYRSHALDDFNQWRTVWQTGHLDAGTLVRYGERMEDRFDLLHPSRPLYQVASLPEEKEHPVADLLLEAAHGNNPTLFDHGQVEGSQEIPLDRAACYLVALQLFAIGGGVSKPFNRMDAPLAKGIVVEVIGATLFETLMLNAIPMESWDRLVPPSRMDMPFWEEEVPVAPSKEGTPIRGPLHYLTWQSRRVQLLVDRSRGAVTGCKIAQRYCLPKDGNRLDPGKAYVRDEKQGWVARRLQKDRAAWRLTHVLLQPTDEKDTRPEVVSWLAALRRHEALGHIKLPAAVSLAVSGLTTDPTRAAKIELWRREEVGLPLTILERPDLVVELEHMMSVASAVERHLRRTGEALLWSLAEGVHQREALQYLWTGKGKMPPTISGMAQSLGLTLRYWAAMERPFRTALWTLSEHDIDAHLAEWSEALKQNAISAFTAVLEGLKAGGSPWEPLSVMEDAFRRRLSWLVKRGEGEVEGDEHVSEDGSDH